MKYTYDVVVVGGGFSGMIAAAAASDKGKKTVILTKGAGTLSIGGGVIDVLGFDNDLKAVNDPFDAMQTLDKTHPYAVLGADAVKEAVDYFMKLSAEAGYPFKHCGSNCFVPTAAGSLKPTYLVPQGYDLSAVSDAKKITVLGVSGMKDFYPELMVKGFRKREQFKDKEFATAMLDCPFDHGRDINALDVARHAGTAEGWKWLSEGMGKLCKGSTVVILPPILGTEPYTRLFKLVKENLGFHPVETQVMPPSVSGLRIRKMLVNKLKSNKVDLVELAEVVRADVENGICKAVYTTAPDKERGYAAKEFIIATGGFFGGGIVAEPGKAYEQIFGIDLNAPKVQEDWSAPRLFGEERHLFASMGVSVNKELLPLDANGEVILKNVRFAGRTVGGYDFVTEKSGNGVALTTGYAAGRI